MSTLDTILTEANQTENSIVEKIQNSSFFRRISKYGKGIVHTVTQYRKSLAVAGLVGILAYGGECSAQEFYIGPGICQSVAMDRERNFIITQDHAAQRFNKSGEKIGNGIAFSGYRPSVAMDKEGNFIITWERVTSIHAQRYDKEGNKIGEEFQVNTLTEYYQVSPVVAMNDEGRFAICWKYFIFDDDTHNAFYAQIFDKHGNRVGHNFFVGQYLGGLENPAGIAMNDNGDFVVTWDSRIDSPIFNSDIFAQRYNWDGHKLGEKFVVNTYLDDSQYEPDIAMDREGNFVITWCGAVQGDESPGGVAAQRFDKDGNRIGGEFLVNSYTDNSQGLPRITMDKERNFVIAWRSSYQDGDMGGVYAQRFNREGDRIGGEFRVNSYTEHEQFKPRIAMNNSGNIVAAWTTERFEGYVPIDEAYARIFPFYNPADFNKDGYVNFKDFAIFSDNWLAYYP